MEKENKKSSVIILLLVIIIALLIAGIVYLLKQTNKDNLIINSNNNIDTAEQNKQVEDNNVNIAEQNKQVENNIENLVTNIETEQIELNDCAYYLKVSGIDKNNNVIWKYTTEEGYHTQYDSIYILQISDKIVYIKENEKIVALNKNDGTIKWSNKYNDLENLESIIDSKENLYLIGYSSLYIVDINGDTIKKITYESLEPEMVCTLKDDETKILIESMGEKYLEIDLNDYTVTKK